jgi:hypothetical protein
MNRVYVGMPARLADGTVCQVTDVLIDPRDGRVDDVVLDANGYFGPDVVAPISAVWLVDGCVHLSLTCADLAVLPRYNAQSFCRESGLRSCAMVRHGFHWPHRAGMHVRGSSAWNYPTE